MLNKVISSGAVFSAEFISKLQNVVLILLVSRYYDIATVGSIAVILNNVALMQIVASLGINQDISRKLPKIILKSPKLAALYLSAISRYFLLVIILLLILTVTFMITRFDFGAGIIVIFLSLFFTLAKVLRNAVSTILISFKLRIEALFLASLEFFLSLVTFIIFDASDGAVIFVAATSFAAFVYSLIGYFGFIFEKTDNCKDYDWKLIFPQSLSYCVSAIYAALPMWAVIFYISFDDQNLVLLGAYSVINQLVGFGLSLNDAHIKSEMPGIIQAWRNLDKFSKSRDYKNLLKFILFVLSLQSLLLISCKPLISRVYVLDNSIGWSFFILMSVVTLIKGVGKILINIILIFKPAARYQLYNFLWFALMIFTFLICLISFRDVEAMIIAIGVAYLSFIISFIYELYNSRKIEVDE